MDANDWYECGARIGELVQKAVDSNNFTKLSQTIMDTLGSAVSSAAEDIGRDSSGPEPAGNGIGSYRQKGSAYQNAKARANVGDLTDILRSRRSSPSQYKGIFSMVAGFGLAAVSVIIAVALWGMRLVLGIGGLGIGAWFFMILAAVFALAGARGGAYRSRMRQLQQYLKIMDGRDTVTVEELARGSGKSVKAVKKDLKAMMRDGMFAGSAYMDEQETALMTSREAYMQYEETMKEYARRSREVSEAQRRAAEKDLEACSEETRGILKEGREFVSHIEECNERIDDGAMSEKLDHLTMVVGRIFDQVAEKPESAPDMHRMMSYYLPVTRKLVDAYADLERQSVGGENITKTRREIEASLDTINGAFETFLDSFYQDTAWDISSDISALKTMMARDGLTGSGFGNKQKIKTVSQDISGTAAAAAAMPLSEKDKEGVS